MGDELAKYVDRAMSLLGLRPAEDRAVSSPMATVQESSDTEPPKATAESLQQGDDEPFETRLKAFVAQRGTCDSLLAGRVHLINVGKIRERLGERWPRFAERVHEVIKTEIKTRLGPQDLFRRVSAECYVIVFADCPEAEARLKVALLSEQILETLLGEAEAKDLSSLGVQRLVVKADGRVATEALNSIKSLMAMLDDAELSGEKSATFDYQAFSSGRRALTAEEVAQLLGVIDLKLTQLENIPGDVANEAPKSDQIQYLISQLKDLEDSVRARVPPFTANGGRGQIENYLAVVRDSKPDLEKVETILERAKRQRAHANDWRSAFVDRERVEISARVEFSYQPMWHAPTQQIGIYVCSGRLHDRDGRSLKLTGLARDQEADLYTTIDQLALQRTRKDMDAATENGVQSILMVPIHYSTLQRHSSQVRLLELCSHLSAAQRKLLGWEILGAQVRSWREQIAQAITHIKPFGRAIFLRIGNLQGNFSAVQRNLPHLRSAGVHAVGVDIAGLQGPESEKLKLLEDLAELADKSGLRCYGHGFESLSMTICAVCMGYQNVSGPAIAGPTVRPAGIRATDMENIYGRGLYQRSE